MKTKKAIILSVTLLVMLGACSKKSEPAPAPSNPPAGTIVKNQQVYNSFTLGGTTYNTTVGLEMTQMLGSSDDYVLAIGDSYGNTLQFWFPQKPSAGTYAASSDQTTAIASNGTLVGVTVNGVDYASVGTGNVTISTNSGGYYITLNNVPVQNLSNTSQATTVSASVSIP